MPKTCSICLEPVSRPAKLMLNCECKYYTHYKCYYTWWKDNHNCIICHELSSKPLKYNNRTPPRRRELIRRIDRRRTHTLNRFYTVDTRQIHDYMNTIPFDNENELKTIVCAFIIGFFCYFFTKFIIYSNLYN